MFLQLHWQEKKLKKRQEGIMFHGSSLLLAMENGLSDDIDAVFTTTSMMSS